jgi:hypothetical protein
MEIGYECSREKEIEILTNSINNYTGPIYSLELPKTHPRSPGYSYSKKNLVEYMRLRMDFDFYIDNLRNKDI